MMPSDLIGHTQAAIGMRRMGVPKVSVDCLFMTLQEATQRVRMGYGDCQKIPMGESPMRHLFMGYVKVTKLAKLFGRAVVSSPLLDIHRKKDFDFYFFNPISKREVKFLGYAYVEDINLVQTLREA
jgi:hypothetical protein